MAGNLQGMGPMEAAIKAVESTTQNYQKDLEAMTEEQILTSLGGSSRIAVDFTYEVGLVNRRIAARIAGTEPPAMPDGDEWLTAPEELRTKAAIIAYMSESTEVLLAAAKAVPEDEAGKMVGPEDAQRPAYGFAYFAAIHTMYHDGQLNFIQSLTGDLKVHWH